MVRVSCPGIPLCPDDGPCGYNAGRLHWTDGTVDLALFPRRRHRHRIDRAEENDLDDRGALHFTWRPQRCRSR